MKSQKLKSPKFSSRLVTFDLNPKTAGKYRDKVARDAAAALVLQRQALRRTLWQR